jgi:hypothetical protein
MRPLLLPGPYGVPSSRPLLMEPSVGGRHRAMDLFVSRFFELYRTRGVDRSRSLRIV